MLWRGTSSVSLLRCAQIIRHCYHRHNSTSRYSVLKIQTLSPGLHEQIFNGAKEKEVDILEEHYFSSSYALSYFTLMEMTGNFINFSHPNHVNLHHAYLARNHYDVLVIFGGSV